MSTNPSRWRVPVTAGLAAASSLALYQRNTISSFLKTSTNSGDACHTMIHMDINKTMIMSDAVQGLGLRHAINTILADRGCFGTVVDINSLNETSENDASLKHQAIGNKVWIPDTDHDHASRSSTSQNELMSYGEFIRTAMPYVNHAVDPNIKRKRLELRSQFTDIGHSGHEYRAVVDSLCQKLDDQWVMPAFWNLIDFLWKRYQQNGKQTFSILFRTFGTDLHDVVKVYNQYCTAKGYEELVIDWSDASTHGVFVHHQNELYLIVGTVEIEEQFLRVREGMTREWINRVDRLAFYRNKQNVVIYKGYDEIHKQMAQKNMAVRDDYTYWALHGEKSEHGKVFLIDRNDRATHPIFFDDCGSYVLNIRDLKDSLQPISFAEVDGVYAVDANSYEIMINERYFVEQLQNAETVRSMS